MKIKFLYLFIFIALAAAAHGQDEEHEYASFQQGDFRYANWTYQEINTGENINLYDFAKDKKQVLVFYFAPWCKNSRYEVSLVNALFDKFQSKGFGVIGISLYAPKEKAQEFVRVNQIRFPVVAESLSRNDRTGTLHYKYRQKLNDQRKWGTPFNVFLDPSKFGIDKKFLTSSTLVVPGELRKLDAEQYLQSIFPEKKK